MANGEYKLIKDNGSTLDEKTILAEEAKALSFDSSLNPVMKSIARLVEVKIVADATALTTGDGVATFTIPAELNGFKLTRAEMAVKTASSSGTVSAMIRNITTAHDMLSTSITIDATELNSYSAVNPSVVNATYQAVSTGDTIAIDIDSIGTGTKGGDIILSFI